MYPAALHKTPTQTVDSSQVFGKVNSPKATKDDQKIEKRLGVKQNQRSGTGLPQTGPRLPFLLVVVKDTFV